MTIPFIQHAAHISAAAAALAADETAAAPPSGKTMIEYIQSGGIVGFVIIGLSFVAVALVVVHLVQCRRSQLMPPALAEAISRAVRENDIQGAIAICRNEGANSFLGSVVGSALHRCSRSPLGFFEIRTAVEEAAQREVDRLTRVTEWIGLIAAVGPMLGLLGTVFGMIGAFNSIGAAEGASRSRELAGFMSLALVTTAMGLAVAIPCTAAFSIFRRRIDRAVAEVGEAIETIIAPLEASSGIGGAAQTARQAPASRPTSPGAPSAAVRGGVNA